MKKIVCLAIAMTFGALASEKEQEVTISESKETEVTISESKESNDTLKESVDRYNDYADRITSWNHGDYCDSVRPYNGQATFRDRYGDDSSNGCIIN